MTDTQALQERLHKYADQLGATFPQCDGEMLANEATAALAKLEEEKFDKSQELDSVRHVHGHAMGTLRQQVAELKAQGEKMREALIVILPLAKVYANAHAYQGLSAKADVKQAETVLALTPPQCLAEHDDALIEKCAEECDMWNTTPGWRLAQLIRSLKSKPAEKEAK